MEEDKTKESENIAEEHPDDAEMRQWENYVEKMRRLFDGLHWWAKELIQPIQFFGEVPLALAVKLGLEAPDESVDVKVWAQRLIKDSAPGDIDKQDLDAAVDAILALRDDRETLEDLGKVLKFTRAVGVGNSAVLLDTDRRARADAAYNGVVATNGRAFFNLVKNTALHIHEQFVEAATFGRAVRGYRDAIREAAAEGGRQKDPEDPEGAESGS